jgi:hypothetical protein
MAIRQRGNHGHQLDDSALTADDIIEFVATGEITKEEAEKQAKRRGWEPFEKQPPWPLFDPSHDLNWTVVMTIAWIGSRDLLVVRECNAEFLAQCREWHRHGYGWVLESRARTTFADFKLGEIARRGTGEKPCMRHLSAPDAKEALWHALSTGHIVAQGNNTAGIPVEIASLEWGHLKLSEVWDEDVVDYKASPLHQPYTGIALPRDVVMRLWPPSFEAVAEVPTGPVTAEMIKPMSDPGTSGYVPVCSALHWIMTKAGTRDDVMMDDRCAWDDAVQQLWPPVCSDEIELIGLKSGDSRPSRIEGRSLALLKVLWPLSSPIGDILTSAPSHISCSAYLGPELWLKDFSDKLYDQGRPGPAVTHLQVIKNKVLERWPRSTAAELEEEACSKWLIAEVEKSPFLRTKNKAAFWLEAQGKYPNLPKNRFLILWTTSLGKVPGNRWSKGGRPKEKPNFVIAKS